MAHWGVGDPALTAGGLDRAPSRVRRPARSRCVQRKTTPIGKDLGKTSRLGAPGGAQAVGVEQVSGATYDRIDDDGLHITVDGEPQVLEVDHVVVCAGPGVGPRAVRRPRTSAASRT